MKIFVSWSGNQSHLLAEAFREWLPSVFQSVKVFVSSKDIHAGVQWFPKLKTELEETGFGIVCLTRSNLTAPFIMLESGAIALKVGEPKLVPVLCDLSEAELGKNPLTAFNYVHLSKEGMWKLAQSINDSLEEGKRPVDLEKTFNKWWPELEEQVKIIVSTPDTEAPKKKIDSDAVLEEILSIVRGLARSQEPGPLTKAVNWNYINYLVNDLEKTPRAHMYTTHFDKWRETILGEAIEAARKEADQKKKDE